MPKLIVIIIFSILVISVITGGGFLLWQRFGGSTTPGLDGQTPGSLFGNLPPADQSDSTPPTGPVSINDNDNDGLTNDEETTWKTDPNKPDTDGDGYLDSEEVAANHDPLKPAPNDLLAPTNPKPAASQLFLTPATLEQYFSDDSAQPDDSTNLTEKYNNEYSEKDRSPATMSDYADQQPIMVKIPRPDSSLIPSAAKENTPSMIAQYLSVADNPGVLANPTLYFSAQNDLYANGNSSTMQGIATLVRSYRDNLLTVPVPETALPVHTLLLGYTDALATTFDQIALWNEDPVKSLVATRQLEVIDRQYYPIIYQELQRLQALR